MIYLLQLAGLAALVFAHRTRCPEKKSLALQAAGVALVYSLWHWDAW